jgi:hypothetical protein
MFGDYDYPQATPFGQVDEAVEGGTQSSAQSGG